MRVGVAWREGGVGEGAQPGACAEGQADGWAGDPFSGSHLPPPPSLPAPLSLPCCHRATPLPAHPCRTRSAWRKEARPTSPFSAASTSWKNTAKRIRGTSCRRGNQPECCAFSPMCTASFVNRYTRPRPRPGCGAPQEITGVDREQGGCGACDAPCCSLHRKHSLESEGFHGQELGRSSPFRRSRQRAGQGARGRPLRVGGRRLEVGASFEAPLTAPEMSALGQSQGFPETSSEFSQHIGTGTGWTHPSTWRRARTRSPPGRGLVTQSNLLHTAGSHPIKSHQALFCVKRPISTFTVEARSSLRPLGQPASPATYMASGAAGSRFVRSRDLQTRTARMNPG